MELPAVRVQLTKAELTAAAATGCLRQIESVLLRLKDKHGFDGDTGWTVHIEGAAGEMAVAKALGRYWGAGVGTFKGGDVGAVQVRTRSRDDYDLIVRSDDSDEDVFVLVIGRAPNYEVVGWIKGRDAKRREWLRDYGGRPPAWFVPQASLNRFPADEREAA